MTSGNFNQLPPDMIGPMQDSNYYERKGIPGVYKPRNKKAPVISGTPTKNNRFAGMFSEGGFLDNSMNFLGKSYFNDAQSDQDKMIGLNEKYIEAMKGMPQFSNQRFAGQFLQADDGNFNVKFGTPASVAMFKEGATTGKSIGDRIKGGAGGLISGLSTGIPHMGGVGLVAGLL